MKPADLLYVLIGLLGLVGVRMVEDQIFYDPFLDYFRQVDQQPNFPDFDWNKLIFSHLLRFFFNLLLSALVIQFIFKNKNWTVQAVLLMVLFFLITFPIYLYCITTQFEIGELFSFYMRRFVIQPLILLLIIPMFYYRKQLQQRQNS